MADGGASELIMLISGLLVAGIVTTLLVASWGGLANSVDTAQNQVEANSKTKAALTVTPCKCHGTKHHAISHCRFKIRVDLN